MQAQENFTKVDAAMNEAIRFDEMWFEGDQSLKKINDDLERFVK